MQNIKESKNENTYKASEQQLLSEATEPGELRLGGKKPRDCVVKEGMQGELWSNIIWYSLLRSTRDSL